MAEEIFGREERATKIEEGRDCGLGRTPILTACSGQGIAREWLNRPLGTLAIYYLIPPLKEWAILESLLREMSVGNLAGYNSTRPENVQTLGNARPLTILNTYPPSSLFP